MLHILQELPLKWQSSIRTIKEEAIKQTSEREYILLEMIFNAAQTKNVSRVAAETWCEDDEECILSILLFYWRNCSLKNYFVSFST